ncbi:ABC transporter ATP-binding protein, partial [Georgenia sp. 10Sc9-8]|nr:ABC transporter ATP-binding protein [Georgenia halotolerans]
RVALARALLTEAPALVLIEPTSAVDAHTEARIAARLARHRRGRSTVVVTTSPLVLEHADEVVLLDGGRERVRGPHRVLLARAADGDRDAGAYRAVVHRGSGTDTAAHAGTEAR